ncbi:hypothetical protein BCR35DRAFT_103630 [Leucosporidium creatinivorum]|uniref:F-box domain-containing protein n=1 Tax=Leucosporidium creatinivorum TaxID=106004 RepID=A0A1Y2G1A4_9BASI|nr:hypothetical protein BCR35DRAFT_103630 [Leucosporidium creatinivorum]
MSASEQEQVKIEPQEEQLAVKVEDPAPPAQQQQQLTIPDLPKEVLHRILSMTTEQLSFTSRYRNLKSTALVAKAWRGPSQELLCRDAVFHSVATIQRWLESEACSRYPSERIEIDGRYGQVDAHSAEQVVARATGVRRLRLDFIRGISSRILTTPNLASECLIFTLALLRRQGEKDRRRARR